MALSQPLILSVCVCVSVSAGVHAGADVSCPVPGELSHDAQSSPPEDPEEQREAAEGRLKGSMCGG